MINPLLFPLGGAARWETESSSTSEGKTSLCLFSFVCQITLYLSTWDKTWLLKSTKWLYIEMWCCNCVAQIADYYYEERLCVLRCVLHLLTYFQDERHPYRVNNSSRDQLLYQTVRRPDSLNSSSFSLQAEYSNCVSQLEKDLVSNYRKQFELLSKLEAPTWETHGNLMVRGRLVLWLCSEQHHN